MKKYITREFRIASRICKAAPVTLAIAQIFASNALAQSATQLNAIEIVGSDEIGYVAAKATTATKMDVPIQDVPQSIQVVTHDLIQDQGGLARLNDLGRNVSGVFIQEPGQGGSNTASYVIRGFSTNFWQLIDGVRRSSNNTSPDISYIDHVEFLKGPASVLYGDAGGSHGGLVNFVTKKPSKDPIAEVELTAGSYGFLRSTLDFGRPLNDDQTLLFRFNAAVEQGNSFRDGIKHDTQFVAPSLSWAIDNNNKLLFQLEYGRNFYVNDWGWPVDPAVLKWDRHVNVGEPNYEGNTNTRTNAVVTYDHRFNDQWRLHLVGSQGDSPSMGCHVSSYIADPVNTPNIVSRYAGCSGGPLNESDLQAEILGDLRWGDTKHTTLIGLQQSSSKSDSWYDQGSTLADFDILSPIHGIAVTAPTGPNGTYGSQSRSQAVYAQDLIALGSHFKLLAGLRQDSVSSQSFSGGVQTDDRQDSHFSPRFGLVYQPNADTSIYASFSNSFTPNGGRLASGAIPSPEQGVQSEIGWKQDLLDGKANLNVAVFDLIKKDSAQSDLATDPTGNTVILVGEMRSKGIEFDLGGNVTSRLRLTASLAFLDAVVTADTNIPVGTRLVGAPQRTFNLFGVYRFSDSAESKALELGGGYYYASETEGAYLGASNQFQLPAVQRIDAYLSYPLSARTKLQINVTNLLDRNNFLSNGWSPWPDQPRSVYATLRSQF